MSVSGNWCYHGAGGTCRHRMFHEPYLLFSAPSAPTTATVLCHLTATRIGFCRCISYPQTMPQLSCIRFRLSMDPSFIRHCAKISTSCYEFLLERTIPVHGSQLLYSCRQNPCSGSSRSGMPARKRVLLSECSCMGMSTRSRHDCHGNSNHPVIVNR